MLKSLIACCCFLLCSWQTTFASPLSDFNPGNTAVDLSWKAYSFEGGHGGPDIMATTALNTHWALNYRQVSYEPDYSGIPFKAKNRELNLVYKISPTLQAYAGWSRTTGNERISGYGLPSKNVGQIGIMAERKLGRWTTLYTILGGGPNVANVEFGLSQEIWHGLELTASYRHFTVEKVGSAEVKENLRGFGVGVTLKI